MYTFVKMIAKVRGRHGAWFESVDSTTPVRKISSLYNKCYLILSNPYYTTDITLDCAEVESDFARCENGATIAQWLTNNGTKTLPVIVREFNLKFEHAQYRDAIQAGWKPQLCHRTVHHSIPLPKSELDDVRMTKDNVTAEQFVDHCLVTVNNLVHFVMDGDEGGVQIVDAGVSNRIYNDNHIGILNFERIGKITTIPITEEMIASSNGGGLKDMCFIKVPESFDVESCFPMISIGGFLHSLGKIVSYVGNNCYKINMGDFGWEARYYELLKRLDLATLHEHMSPKNGTYVQVANEELFSDEVLKALLTLSNSFVVLVHNSNVVTQIIPMEVTETPGVYLTQSPMSFPVIYNKGMLYDGWVIDEMDRSVVKGKENFRPTYNHETTHVFLENSIDDTQYSYEPNRFSRAWKWVIATATFD